MSVEKPTKKSILLVYMSLREEGSRVTEKFVFRMANSTTAKKTSIVIRYFELPLHNAIFRLLTFLLELLSSQLEEAIMRKLYLSPQ